MYNSNLFSNFTVFKRSRKQISALSKCIFISINVHVNKKDTMQFVKIYYVLPNFDFYGTIS